MDNVKGIRNHRSPLRPIGPVFWSTHRWLWWGIGVFVLLGALVLVWVPQGADILWFSERRTAFWNVFFRYTTKIGEETGFLVVFLILLALRRYRSALAVPFLALLVTLVTAVSKQLFRHPRPMAWFRAAGEEELLTLVDGVRVNVSQVSSFPSGHTMAGFALLVFFIFTVPLRRWSALLIFTLAILVGLSRVYLVQHFWKDIYLGGIMGIGCALFMYYGHLSVGSAGRIAQKKGSA